MQKANVTCRYGAECRNINKGCLYRHCNFKMNPKHSEHDNNRQHDKRDTNHSSSHFLKRSRHEEESPQQGHLQNRKKFRNNHQQRPHHNRSVQRGRDNYPAEYRQRFYSHFCQQYHHNNACNNTDRSECRKSHYFMLHQPTKIRRVYFTKQIPLSSKSRLFSTVCGDKIMYNIRGKDSVQIFTYTPQKSQLDKLEELPLGRNDEKYFSNNGLVFYCSFENQITSFEDIQVNDMVGSKSYAVENGHTKTITGILQMNQTLFTTSLDGELKVWNIVKDLEIKKELLTNNVKYTNYLKALYNPSSTKLSLNFIQKAEHNQDTILVVGTDDSRLFFVSSEQSQTYKETTLRVPSSTRLNLLRTRIVSRQGKIQAIYVLASDGEKHYIFRGSISDMKFQVLYTDSNARIDSVYSFQVYEDLLIVAVKYGVVFYRMPDTKHKIGCILHKNPVRELVIDEYQNKSTAVKFPLMAVLEASCEQKDDSGQFSIYLIR